MRDPKIIFEDDHLMVIDKPSGWIVNESETTKNQKVLQSWLKNQNYPISKSRGYRSGIVHRLDKETSGVLLVAKTTKSFKILQSQFKDRKVKKVYTALTHGKLEPKTDTIKAPVGRLPWNRERFGVLPGGRSAETKYTVVDYYQHKEHKEVRPLNFSLVELKPKTGRTHQIRIHLKYLGHPIVGDDFYAGRKTARVDRKWCPRLFLHASGITFRHPETYKKVSYQSSLPLDLKKALDTLKN